MMSVKVSIIIPVFNVENYLAKCLKSVTLQSLREIEIICINDASTDSSPDILRQFQQTDERIKVVNIERSRQGVARNTGIKEARGEYVGFVDADDEVDDEMFEKLYRTAVEKETEIAFCFTGCYDERHNRTTDFPYFKTEKIVLDGKEKEVVYEREEIAHLLPFITVVAWNKIYKRSMLQDRQISFIPGPVHEDIPFFFQALLHASKVALVRESLYRYTINRTGSTMNSINRDNYDYIIEALKTTEHLISGHLTHAAVRKSFMLFKVRQLLHSLNGVYLNTRLERKMKNLFFRAVRDELRLCFPPTFLSRDERRQFWLICSNRMNLFRWKVGINQLKMKVSEFLIPGR